MAEFSVRQPCARDIAPLARILGKIGIGEFKALLTPEAVMAVVGDEADRQARIGLAGMGIVVDAASIVCQNLYRAEGDIFRWLADMAGMTEDEVARLPLADFADLVSAVFKAEGFADFFTRASGLLGK